MDTNQVPEHLETATLAGGCFWCTEAIYKRVKGVVSVTPGYAGGRMDIPNPTYEQVCSGKTGYAEAVNIIFNSKEITFNVLLSVYWATIDPTTLNRQGNDVGTQYRSAIFCHSPEQWATAEASKEALAASGKYSSPIVTEIALYTNFYEAEEIQKGFYDRNSTSPYCRLIIDPKIKLLFKDFSMLAKPGMNVK